ncbi:LysR family transcriptional regulator [Paenarthrobacter ureafaciens]|uniref:LysR family transcriptional regulator n=1 Tax=Paenarthrobacter ureafaciens TaxID=37931 RepID=UPI0015BD17FB|nr:LysR family transcriptional regulator [Paenarthrobacter ureafaciens]MEC3854103.1 LysR family transcriptional regulator [Paenarthrobacter ureafaciens]NWL26318.1 LysR family transcriptional regulator [Paenarthrobacter ureafaciens]
MTELPDIPSLRLLLLIDEYGSLGAAARELAISQPAASARLRALESRYGLSLVTRSTRGSLLTEDGKAVSAWAQNVMNELNRLQVGLGALSAQRRGDLKIAASLTIAEFFLPRWLADLHRSQPGMHIGMLVVNSTEVVSMVRDGQVKLGFIESAVRVPDLNSSQVGSDRLAVVVAPDHPWAGANQPIGRDELAETPFVIREPGSGTRDTFELALGATAKVVLEAGSTNVIIAAALNGVGPAVVSEVAVRPALASGALVSVPVSLDLRRALRAIWRRKDRLRPPIDGLVAIAAKGQE